MMDAVRILLLADTHLGRERSRYLGVERALAPARVGNVDLVVHGGDLLYRSRVPPGLVLEALEPFLAVARNGVPVFLVPGNHERGRLPAPLFVCHPNLHVFHAPDTFVSEVRGIRVALSGFPFRREVGETAFARLVAATGWRGAAADLRFLCLHQAIEGAKVGPSDFTFRRGPDVIAGRSIPRGFGALLAGHIHRHQVLTQDLEGTPFPAPVFYPGATERTSFAERAEAKGYVVLHAVPGDDGGEVSTWRFLRLQAPLGVFDRAAR